MLTQRGHRTKSTSLAQEQPPSNFHVEFLWKPNGAVLDRLDLFNTILFDMAYLAVREWDLPVFVVACPSPHSVAIKFVSDRSGNAMRIKHAMWALGEMFDTFVQQQRYTEANVLVELTPQRLGVGNVKFDLSDATYKNNNSTASFVGLTNARSGVIVAVQDMSQLNATSTDNQQGDDNNTETSQTTTLKNLTGRIHKDVTVQVAYRTGGATFPDVQIYKTSLQLLITAAQHQNIDESIGPVFSIHNDIANFTISFTPYLFVKGNELSWLDCINSIAALVPSMAMRPPEKAWAEIDGSIQDGDDIIGWFCIDKGDLTRVKPEDLCNKRYPDTTTEQ
ncbi:hypothetical protein ACLMJK_005613 [Lecanora helva]